MAKKIPVLFEDNHLLMINKPAGILTIPDRYRPELPNLLDHFNHQYPSIFIVHRLDKETSGVMVLAKQPEAHQILNRQFEKRVVEKYYLAILDGQLSPEVGQIDLPIAPGAQPGKMVVHKKGKSALTTYETIEQFNRFTLVRARIHTGRTHQVRVHFQAIGFPLAVDAVYGKREALFASDIKRFGFNPGRSEDPRPLINRSVLHAEQLTLNHPYSNEQLSIEAPLPKDFRATLNQLRKWDRR